MISTLESLDVSINTLLPEFDPEQIALGMDEAIPNPGRVRCALGSAIKRAASYLYNGVPIPITGVLRCD